ncbi:MAG TPA: flagellar biosynthesis anti-sigma factor FlgM [Tepidisphaeraceae bacterium]|nr:flagellar biosynthesis anti-sigma factor FlgM [Tepidisphaeraceae bacterium]
MSVINNVGTAAPVSKLQAPAPASKAEQPADVSAARGRDSVELSGVQGFLTALKNNDIRTEKVAEIKAQIEAGTYETAEKFDIAADRLLDDVL